MSTSANTLTETAQAEWDAQQATEKAADELEHDLANDPATEAGNAPEGHLIDPAKYETEELRLPKIDGEGVDKICARFKGTVWLDRSDPRDCALIRDLRLGHTVTLAVEAKIGPPVPGYTTSRDGDLDSLVLGRAFDVQSVWRTTLDPEDVEQPELPEQEAA